jgi:Tol biopolymer transport system component
MRSAIMGGGKTYITRNSVGKFDSHPSVRGEIILCDTEVNGKRQIVSMKDNGTEVTILGEGHSPSWHPNPFEAKFIFIRNGDIYEMDLASIQVTQIYSDSTYNCAMPAIHPTGNIFFFKKERNKRALAQ